MLINTIYVNGGSAIISIVTGLHDCDGSFCTPYLESTDMEPINLDDIDGGGV